jgi:hypothetical protein
MTATLKRDTTLDSEKGQVRYWSVVEYSGNQTEPKRGGSTASTIGSPEDVPNRDRSDS